MASDLSNAAQAFDSVSECLTEAMESPTGPSSAALSTAASTATAQDASGWVGLSAWLLLAVINIVSTLLYRIIRIATINMPRILYTLFSTSWTVTMNATTLYACSSSMLLSGLTRYLACSSWLPSCRQSAGS